MTDTVTVKKVSRQERSWPRWISARPRPYLAPSWAEFEEKPRLYISVEGENFLENFAYREDRPKDLYRAFLPEIFERLGLPEGTKARWSHKAGCKMCPCSPGFILTIPGDDPEHKRVDFWATLEGDDAKVAGGANADRINNRAAALAAVAEEGTE